jgi:CHC2 zinc finger
VRLRRTGSDFTGCCPFHEDDSPSLVISPEWNLWHCLDACQGGGSVIDWVMRTEGVPFRHAVELPGGRSVGGRPPAGPCLMPQMATPACTRCRPATVITPIALIPARAVTAS